MPTDEHQEESAEPTGDVEMTETQNTRDGEEQENPNGSELPFADAEIAEPRVTFANYLMSPIVTLLIGSGDQSILTAHQGLLAQSPYFKEICDRFVEDGSPRQIELPDYDIDTVGSFLEFLYTGEYFPRKLPGQRVLESDPSIPSVDNSGDQLLKHARIYTLAEKFGVSGLGRQAQERAQRQDAPCDKQRPETRATQQRRLTSRVTATDALRGWNWPGLGHWRISCFV
ncbi:hypothetical protein CEP52_012584 [Fusarium oligoseptatum]|uniref:BTB domain-containing protein n=1 Tax=Fusarium oligoseptatum TaxID=2604345 RepID=A0A428SXS1_9HYPO|nr:hypothetical protein CEP52_012584 [Fusarium oligoseptatum]